MRKFWYCLIAVILVGAMLTGCLTACKKKTPDDEKTDVIDEPVRAEGIALNWEEVLLAKGTAITLAHTVSPDGATGTATYTSSDTSVVQVNDQGLVSALKAGVSTVRVKIDDSHYAECKVIVGDVLVTPKEEEATPSDGEPATPAEPPTGGTDGEGQGNTGEGNIIDGNGAGTTEGADETGGEPTTGDEPTPGDENPISTDGGDGVGTQSGDATEGNGNQTGNSGMQSDGDAVSGTGESGTDGQAQGTPDAQEGGQASERVQKRTVSGGIKGTTLFDSVQEAVQKAKANDVIVVDKGAYNESVTIDKNVTLMGVENPRLQQITISTGARVKLQNLSVVLEDYPSAGEAAILVKTGAGIEMRDTLIETTATGEPEGGYGVLVEKGSQGVSIKYNVIGNFRYGIYVCPTDQSVTVTDNKLSNMAVGIGLDVRQENAETNYPTLGKIADNEYNEVVKHTQFLHYGENYDGDFDFGDNEEENASQGNSATGGEGLLE